MWVRRRIWAAVFSEEDMAADGAAIRTFSWSAAPGKQAERRLSWCVIHSKVPSPGYLSREWLLSKKVV